MDMFDFRGDERIQKLQEHLVQEPVRQEQVRGNRYWTDRALQEERDQEKEAGSYKNAHSYNALLVSAFPPLPKEAAVNGAPAPEDNLSYKERKKQKKEREKEIEKEREEYKSLVESQQLLDYRHVRMLSQFKTKEGRDRWANTKPGRSKLTRRETMEMMGRGDYSNFENLDDVMRSMFASEALERMIGKFDLPFDMDRTLIDYAYIKREINSDDETFMDFFYRRFLGEKTPENICGQILKEGGVAALLDPTLRLGLSLAQKKNRYTAEQKNWFRELDEQMSAAVMLETLKTHGSEQKISEELIDKQNMNEQDARKAAKRMVEEDEAQKIQIAKRLLLMHLGGLKQVDKDENNKEKEPRNWDKPVAVALSHCSRVTLSLPRCPTMKNGKQVYQKMWDSIFYQQDERGQFKSNLAQDKRRAASTHSVKIRRAEHHQRKAVEEKVLFNFVGQRGMNVAIGGLGNKGISGQMISNDGSCGHFYSMYKEGNTTTEGVMLMGLESDCPGVMNQLGHIHDIRATAEKASSLGGQRTDEVGTKYGGRRCDLSHLSPQDITRYMQMLEDAMKKNSPGIDKFMEMLVGKPASVDSIKRSLEEINK